MTTPWPPVQQAHSRLLIALVVDTSASMSRDGAIDTLNRALRDWREDLHADSHLRRIGEIALITFGGTVAVVDPSGRGRDPVSEPFVPVSDFNPPLLRAAGYTPMVAGIKRAL